MNARPSSPDLLVAAGALVLTIAFAAAAAVLEGGAAVALSMLACVPPFAWALRGERPVRREPSRVVRRPVVTSPPEIVFEPRAVPPGAFVFHAREPERGHPAPSFGSLS